ncbi:MAG: class I SAM-dependent methyltransferase [Actinomycetota bacterium]|nr:class I SAM-dependent methyltransferase [Actinomycetota bacterium]
MSRWARVSDGDGERYAARFADLAASGTDVHGEARFVAALLPAGARVLDAGCGTGRVAVRLAELGYDCVGVDLDESMLAVAGRTRPDLTWLHADLATLDLPALGVHGAFDAAVMAGNIVPLVAEGTEASVVDRLAAHICPGGYVVAGFGLDDAHLPHGAARVSLSSYDEWCSAAGLELERRFATWDGDAYDGGGYAVSVHRRRS